jgi:hypothetical protein
MQILGIFIGLVSGIIWEMLSTSPFKDFPTLIPSLLVNNSSKILHIHHWTIYIAIIFIVLLWSLKTQRLFHPAILMVLSFFVGAIVYNFWKFSDWHKFFE